MDTLFFYLICFSDKYGGKYELIKLYLYLGKEGGADQIM